MAMNRRLILALLTGGAASLSSRFDSAAGANSGPPIAAKPEATRRGGRVRGTGAFPNLKLAGPDRQVRSIAYSRGAYSVTTADGSRAVFLESDLRFKIDSSDLGPMSGKPVTAPGGTVGDRAWVFFSSPEEISTFIERRS
jgi:cytochrome c